MNEIIKISVSASSGFVLGLLTWIIKDMYERYKLNKRLENEIIIQLKTSLLFLQKEFKGLFDIYYPDEMRIIKINNFLKFDFYENNYDKLFFLGSDTCESIYIMYAFLNLAKDKMLFKITNDSDKNFKPEIERINKIILDFSKQNKKFKELENYTSIK